MKRARGGSSQDALKRAQEMMDEAWEAGDAKTREALARKALELSPDCADAYVLLAEETTRLVIEAFDLYQKGVEAGERALGPAFFKENEGYFWGLLETRPYMRARAGLAQCLWEMGRHDESLGHYREMLRLNPNDNQGHRDLLLPRLIELGADREAGDLFKRYKDDAMATWLYSRALLDFRASGDSAQARKALGEALKENHHVPAYLLGQKRLPRHLPGMYGFGDENEAVLYAFEAKKGWKNTKGALDWLGGQAALRAAKSRSRR